MQLAPHWQAGGVQRGELRDEPDLRMLGRIEEAGGPEVLVAPGVVRGETVCLDRQLDRGLRAEVERAVIRIGP